MKKGVSSSLPFQEMYTAPRTYSVQTVRNANQCGICKLGLDGFLDLEIRFNIYTAGGLVLI